MNFLTKSVLVVLLSLFTAYANAYSWLYECDGDPIVHKNDHMSLGLSPVSFPVDGYWWNDIKMIEAIFNAGPSQAWLSTYSGSGDEYARFTYSTSSLVGWADTSYECYWWDGWNSDITDVTISMNSRYAWTGGAKFYAWAYDPSDTGAYDFGTSFLHELLHGFGLDHENRVLSTMNANFPFGGRLGFMPHPLAEDIKGLVGLYGTSKTQNNISLTTQYVVTPAPCYNCSGLSVAKLNAKYFGNMPKGSSFAISVGYQNTGNTTLPSGIKVRPYFCPSWDSGPFDCTPSSQYSYNTSSLAPYSRSNKYTYQLSHQSSLGTGREFIMLWVDPFDSRMGDPTEGIVTGEPIIYDMDNWVIVGYADFY